MQRVSQMCKEKFVSEVTKRGIILTDKDFQESTQTGPFQDDVLDVVSGGGKGGDGMAPAAESLATG